MRALPVRTALSSLYSVVLVALCGHASAVTPGLLDGVGAAAAGAVEGFAVAGEYAEAGWFSMVYVGDEDAAEEYFDRALALDAGDADAIEGAAWLALTRGDMVRAYGLWTDYIGRYPYRVEAEVFARHVTLFDGTVSGYVDAADVLLAAARNTKATPEFSEAAKRTAVNLLLDAGRRAEAEEILNASGYLTGWDVCGVFGRAGMYDLFYEFPVEENPGSEPDVTYGRDEWVRSENDEYTIDFYGVLGSSDGVAYAKKDITVDGGPALLEVTGDDYFVVSYNGAEVLRHTPDGDIARTVHRAYLELPPGPARLLIKTRPNYDNTYAVDNYWDVSVRLLKPDSYEPLEVRPGDGGRSDSLPEVLETNAEPAVGSDGDLYAALILTDEGDYDAAVERIDRVAATAPKCSLFHTLSAYIKLVSGTPFWTAGARSQLRFAEVEDPKNILAVEELGVFASAEGKRDKALEKYGEALDIRTDYVSVICSIAEITRYEEWDPATVRMCERALELNPKTHRALKVLAGYYYDNDNVPAAAEYYERYLRLKARDRDARLRLAEAYIFLGRLDEARGQYKLILEGDPYDDGAYLGLADTATRSGDPAGAIEYLEEGCLRAGWNAELHKELGQALIYAGEVERGYAALRAALELNPSDWQLRRRLVREGVMEPDAVDRALAVDIGEYAAEELDADEYPLSDSVMLLDQLAVYLNPDYSFREENHNLIWILNDEGRERWGEILIMDDPGTEILEARTHLPGGGYFDAISIKKNNGQNIISMEGVRPGSVLEVKYNLSINRRMVFDLLDFYSNPFYLQEVAETLLNTRYAFVVSDDLGPGKKPRFGKYNGGIKSRKVRGDGRTAYVFEKRDSRAVKMELMGPPPRTYLPYVTVSTIPDMGIVADWYRGTIWGKKRLDGRLRAELSTAVEGAAADRERARAVYRYVVNTVESMGGSVFYPGDVRTVAFHRNGSTADRALMISAMLDELGIENELVLLGTSGGKEDWSIPSPELFDTILVYLPGIDGGTYLDPMTDSFAFGDYWSSCYGKEAIYLSENGYRFGVVPKRPFETDSFVLKLTAELAENGRAEVVGRREFRGLRGSYRQVFRNPEDADRNVELNLSDIFEAAVINDYGFENLADMDEVFAITFDAVVPTLGKLRGENIVVPSVPYDFTLASVYVTSVERDLPLRLERPEAYIDEVEIVPPAGYSAADVPADVHLKGPLSEYRVEYRLDGGSVFVRRELFLDRGDISPSDYKKFATFCKEVDKSERREIIFEPGPID
ncbi:MAG: tetratricopeptide repeat protein [Candidatus Coatesbacteria bacterium]|nr:MAG: tetratricopeptide repeat protein [Candidatus Coatesbacteria bacterium]